MINVLIKTDTRYPVNRKNIRKAVAETLSKYKADKGDCEVSVSVVGQRKMDEMCNLYMKDGQKHEVLSFPFEDASVSGGAFAANPDGVLRLGDIILCHPQVLLAAARDDVMVDVEVWRLVCHSVEHLLGKHHE